MNRPAIHARGHAPNCACPRCRHVRWWHERPTGIELRILICVLATAAGAALNLIVPAERLLGTEPHLERSAR